MNPLLRRSFLRLTAALGTAMAFHASAALPADRVGLDAARADAEAGRALLVDIREPHEHATGVSRVAKLLPMREIGARLAEIPKDPDRPVLLICNTQNRSRAAWQALRERGYTNVRYVEGGMSEWARRGLPLVMPAAR
ncbi:MAG: rhodanese-like domain-containing protein [Giesbergeria sp.]|nr:rhodanese-like domain-containing protein [Giesbergeria sp.]